MAPVEVRSGERRQDAGDMASSCDKAVVRQERDRCKILGMQPLGALCRSLGGEAADVPSAWQASTHHGLTS